MSDLTKVPFLANLDADDLEALAGLMEERSYEAGDLIYAEGTPGEGLYCVRTGTVSVMTNASCDGEIMAHLPKDSTFGEAALLNDHPRANAVRAVSDSTILVLPRTAFQAYLAEHPAAGQTVTQALMQRPPRGTRQLMAEVLKPSALFSGVSDDAMLAIARKLRPAKACANDMIFREGESPDALYLVESGTVRLLMPEANGRAPLAEIGPHDYFGEDALLTDQAREIGAQATTTAELWALHRADFDKLVNKHPAAVLTLTRTLAARSERLNRMMLAGVATPKVFVPARRAAPVAVAPHVPDATPVFIEPAVRREPLGSTLRTWLGSLSMPGKLRLGIMAALLAWLLLISLPAVIAGGVPGGAKAPTLAPRDAIYDTSGRGAAAARGLESFESPAVEGAAVSDAAEAPLVALSDLVVPTATPVPTATLVPAPATAVPAVAAAAPAATPAPVISYKVSSGDTLFDIASRFNVDMDVLAMANKISDPSRISVDQELAIPGGDEQAAIATKLAAQPKAAPVAIVAAPAPVSVAAAPAAPVAPAAPEKPALPFVWDGRVDKYNVRLEGADVAPGQTYYRLVKLLFKDTNENLGANLPAGDHNIYVEVLDENGKRMVGAKAVIRNGGTTVLTMENKPFPEYASNFPMYGMMGSYTTWVDGAPSDRVVGMGLPMKWHVSFLLTFQKTTK